MTDSATNNAMPFQIPGGWALRRLSVAGSTFELLLPADPDLVLESHLTADRLRPEIPQPVAPDPYWAALWSSALPTAQAVLRAPWRGDELTLELGCGLGLVGLAALARGLEVTFSDHVSQAIDLALQNAQRNGFTAARGLMLDWEQPWSSGNRRRYDLLLASDVLYSRSCHIPLLNTIDQLLSENGVCWIGDPGRFHSHEFYQRARERFQVRLRDGQGCAVADPAAGQFQILMLSRLAPCSSKLGGAG